MASKNKALDPAAAALSAIEEALKLASVPGGYETAPEAPTPESNAFEAAYDAMSVANAQNQQRNGSLRLPDIHDTSHMPGPNGTAPFTAPSPSRVAPPT